MAKILLTSLLAVTLLAVCGNSVVYGQSISVGDGKLIYQVLFSSWSNPASKLYTGSNCGTLGIVIAAKCDTRFVGYVDIFPENDTRSTTEYTWPGPKKEERWPQIGEDKYAGNTLKDFAYLNLTGVEPRGFREAILRVKVQDANLFNYAEINSYIGRLPGLRDLVVTRYESDSKFSEPIELEPLSTVLPNARDTTKSKPDRATVQQQHLFVKVRAWGATLPQRRPSLRLPPVRDDTLGVSRDSNDAVETLLGSSSDRPRKHRHRHRHPYTSETDSNTNVEGGGGSFLRSPSRTDNYNRYRSSDTDKNE